MTFFTELENSPEVYIKRRKPRIVEKFLRRQNTAEGILISDSEACHPPAVPRPKHSFRKLRYVNQWGRREDPEMNPQLWPCDAWPECQHMQQGKTKVFNRRLSHCKKK